MFKQLMIFIRNLQCVTSDEIFFYFLEKDFKRQQIAGIIGYARSRGVLQIIGRRESTRITGDMNVYRIQPVLDG